MKRQQARAWCTADMNQPVEVRLAQRYPGPRRAPFAYRVGPDGLIQRLADERRPEQEAA